MHLFKFWATALSAALLVACGGGGNGDQAPKVAFTSMVSFGDSLSDVGTYKVGSIALLGGGKYTVNSNTDKNWTELIAAQLGLAAPCAAQTGLDGNADYGFSVAVSNHTECRNYAQGGARVTEAVGPGSKYLAASADLGQLTVPIVTQIANHLSVVNNAFSGRELITVMAGGNDIFMNLGILQATVEGGGDATTAAGAAVTAMGTAGAQLAGYIRTELLANGAKYVVVVNLPDVAGTPFGSSLDDTTKALTDMMVQTFNAQLRAGLAGSTGVLQIDAYTASKDETANPSQYNLSNVSAPACNLTKPSPNALGSSLVCNANNLIVGDTSRYLFADSVHLTPYGYKLLAQLVTKEMVLAGWL